MKAREGDLVETFEGSIFDVKGLVHPPTKVVAFLRYVPDSDGERIRAHTKKETTYRKVYALSKRYALLKRDFPQYLVYDTVFNEYLCEVPLKAVKLHHQPTHHLQDLHHRDTLDDVERQALGFVEILKESANVSWSQMGISGSILVRLHTQASDIDPVVYGSTTCHKVYSTLKSLQEQSGNQVKSYSRRELEKLFDFRSKDTVVSFEDFVRTDLRKASHGMFMGRDYFVRFVKDWDEVTEQYGTIHYKPKGYARIKAKVTNDSEAIFTPCRYEIEEVKVLEGPRVRPIREIVSFRGRFCEQAKNGEVVIAQGKLELLKQHEETEYHRLILGNRISDFMILA